ncbi:hypothetical protein DPMN_055901 [Dreissena polymorpha]|uniref:Uncharacterized protein n=1 Tax=Dreissena polymorpha TaxID=45954 RepID=A0A9D4CTA6_DREPO|nr:hypothetical protein DPMN_055901 [Dreissena polymorpha]
MQEFHFQNCLGGGPPKPPIAGGTSPPPHIPFATSMLNKKSSKAKIRTPLFKTLATGLSSCAHPV